MNAAARAPGLVLIAAGVACGVEASTFNVAFLTDPVGPKALPLLVAVILIGAGIHAAARPTSDGTWIEGSAFPRVGAAVAAFLLYAVALPWVGFFLSTTLVVSTLSGLFGAKLRQAVPAAAALSGALWLIFVLGLGLPLPIGDLWIR